MAKYFGYDGYFLNEEEGNLQDSRFRPFMSYLTSKGLHEHPRYVVLVQGRSAGPRQDHELSVP